MKKSKSILALIMIAPLAFYSCDDDDMEFEEIVITANRIDQSVSFINAETNEVVETLFIPDSDPVYALYVYQNDKIYIADRAQNSVHIVDPDSRTVESSITVGNGVFHMWADKQGSQLWVNNDVDKTVSVIDLSSNTVMETVDLGVKPHDVFLRDNGSKAYVSIFSEMDTPDSVFLYSTSTFERMHAVPVEKDAHLFFVKNGNRVFVACQSGTLIVLNGANLNEITRVDLPGSHGIYHSPENNYLYVTNILGDQIYTVDDSDGELIVSPFDTEIAAPHNLVVNRDGDKLFVTHSFMGVVEDKVTAYTLGSDGSIVSDETITVGTLPFGIAYYMRMVD
ncbi:MAG: YVTN family beta-propeller protein [Crocinitomix sp.]|jgi:YVTN family beta-propeller protein